MHHGVRITDAAIVAAATLVKPLHYADRFLPDKAIDLVDEAASAPAHGGRFSKPEAIDETRP